MPNMLKSLQYLTEKVNRICEGVDHGNKTSSVAAQNLQPNDERNVQCKTLVVEASVGNVDVIGRDDKESEPPNTRKGGGDSMSKVNTPKEASPTADIGHGTDPKDEEQTMEPGQRSQLKDSTTLPNTENDGGSEQRGSMTATETTTHTEYKDILSQGKTDQKTDSTVYAPEEETKVKLQPEHDLSSKEASHTTARDDSPLSMESCQDTKSEARLNTLEIGQSKTTYDNMPTGEKSQATSLNVGQPNTDARNTTLTEPKDIIPNTEASMGTEPNTVMLRNARQVGPSGTGTRQPTDDLPVAETNHNLLVTETGHEIEQHTGSDTDDKDVQNLWTQQEKHMGNNMHLFHVCCLTVDTYDTCATVLLFYLI